MGSDEGPSFWEGLVPNLKIMAVRDDFGKAEIMESSFKDDPRWGGAFVDKFGLPMIMWNEKPYYVNKPGASSQDQALLLVKLQNSFLQQKLLMQVKLSGQFFVGVLWGTQRLKVQARL